MSTLQHLQFWMNSFHICHNWSLAWGVSHAMTFDLNLYLHGYLAMTLPILWVIFTCGTNTTREGTMCHVPFPGQRSRSSAAENAKSWVAQRTTHGLWLGGLSQVWVVCQLTIFSEHEINQNGQKEAIGIRVLLRHKYKRTHDISESYVQFHSKILTAKPKESIGRQTYHRWWDIGSPGGFMGRIWRPYFSSTEGHTGRSHFCSWGLGISW